MAIFVAAPSSMLCIYARRRVARNKKSIGHEKNGNLACACAGGDNNVCRSRHVAAATRKCEAKWPDV